MKFLHSRVFNFDSHRNCTYGDGNAWTQEPTRRYFKRCDTCGTLRPWANYYEVYYADVDREETCWWWECTTCLIKTISDYAEVWRHEAEVAEREKHSDSDGIRYVACPGCGVEIDLQESPWRREDGPCTDGNYWCLNPFNDGQCCGCVSND